MSAEHTEIVWLDQRHELSLTELAEISGLSENELRELADFGAIVPVDPGASQLVFYSDCIVTARTACRLRADFELDAPGVALALTLLERIRDLEARLRYLGAQLPHRV